MSGILYGAKELLHEEMLKAFEREQAKNIKPEPGRVFGINRNTVCPCGSGKKYKHCCLKT